MTTTSSGLSLQSYIPVRRDPFERSEMVTQVLFGECVNILDEEGKWLYIKLLFDGYEGWIDRKCLTFPIEDGNFKIKYTALENTMVTDINTQVTFSLPIGSVIPVIIKDRFTINGNEYRIHKRDSFFIPGEIPIEKITANVIGVPYIWGGRSGFGFDCSGLTQYVFRALAKKIPRDSGDQAIIGKTVNLIDDTKTGDLAFFDDIEGLIHHVGIILNGNQIVHASGKVRCDKIDQVGIFNEETGEYTHKLRVIKRL